VKWQLGIIFFLLCVNVFMTLVSQLDLPGTEYVEGFGTGSTTDYESKYNATGLQSDFEAGLITNVGFGLGDLVFAPVKMFGAVSYLVVGFPALVHIIAAYFDNATVYTVIVLFGDALYVLILFATTIFILEFIRGVRSD